MRLTVDHSALRSALQMCSVTKGAKNTIPILANVLLVTDGDTLLVCSTDLSLTVMANAPARVREPGRCTVELAALLDVLKTAHDAVALSLERGRLRVVTDGATFTLPILPAEDYPTLPVMDGAQEIEFSASEILPALRAVSYPMCDEETRFNLAGVFMAANGSELDLCASDGKRMALATLSRRAAPKSSLLIPRALVKAAEKFSVSREATEIALRWSDNHASLTLDAALLHIRGDERFPSNYRNMFPEKVDARMRVNTEQMLHAVQAVGAFGRGSTKVVRLSLDGSALTIDGESETRGACTTALAVEYSGEPIAAEFASRYLLDPLAIITTAQAELSFSKSQDPLTRKVGWSIVLEPADSSLPFAQRHIVVGMTS